MKGMAKYILHRLVLLIPVVIGVSFLIFFIVNLAPGNPAQMIAGAEASMEDIQRIEEELGLNKNIFVRYFEFMRDFILHGDLGTSYYSDKAVVTAYFERFPATLRLAASFIIVAVALSLPLGILAAVKQYSIIDRLSSFVALIAVSMPNFWLGILLILLFSEKLGWLPSGGDKYWYSIILPALTIGLQMMALMTRMTRSSMLEVIRQDYVNTARAKGLSEKIVILKHALRNALIPIITSAGSLFVDCVGGSVVTETIFSWPGVGKLLVDSISKRDLPMVIGFVTITTIVITICNLGIDIIYALVDPRIRSQYASGK